MHLDQANPELTAVGIWFNTGCLDLFARPSIVEDTN